MQNDSRTSDTSHSKLRAAAGLAALLGLVLALSACGTTGADPGDPDALRLVLVDRGGADEGLGLQDAVLSGIVHVRVDTDRDIDGAKFYLDDEQRAAEPFVIDDSAPFGVQIDTTRLEDGAHDIVVIASSGSGADERVVGRPARASFRVRNGHRGDDGAGADDDSVPGAPLDEDDAQHGDDGDRGGADDGGSDDATGSPAPIDPSYDHLEQVHVDPDSGSDGNSGTADSPLATLRAGIEMAVDNRDRGVGTRVLLHSGVYREGIDDYYGSSGPLVVLQAVEEGEAVVSGSDVWTDWSCDGSICTHGWPYDWGDEANPWPEADLDEIGARREMVFVDGERLEQTLSRSEMRSRAGTFYVDEGSDQLQMHLPSGVDVDASLVEVAVRARLLWAQTLHDLVIDGVVFQHAATPVSKSAVYVIEQNRVTIEDVTVRDNNWDGLSFALGSDLTLRRSRLNRNGGSGVGAYKTVNVLLEDNETNYNNWRGHAGGLIGWAVGQKFLRTRDLTIRRHTSTHNYARGLWLDFDVHNALIEDVYVCENVNDGIFIEASPGPITVRESTFCDNGGSGIQTSSLHDFTLESTTLSGNEESQIHLTGDYDRSVDDYLTGETHVLSNEDWTWRDNVMVSLDGQPIVSTTFPDDEWDRLMSSSDLDFTSYEATRAQAFETPEDTLTFDEWQEATHQDGNSTFGGTMAAFRSLD